MINTIQVQTANGLIDFEVMHKNDALQVVKAATHDPEFFFYNIVHNNGLKVPNTNMDEIADAILICNWCVENFPEFSTEIFNMSKSRQDEFKDRLYEFKLAQIKDWEDDSG